MKRKVDMYVVTYNNDKILNDWFLRSLHDSSFPRDAVRVTIINNYSDCIEYDKSLVDGMNFRVFHNQVRPDGSHGHLARNWNQAILLGFESLTAPVSEYVVAVQNDTKLTPNWFEEMMGVMSDYDYLTMGIGDQFQVWAPEAVHNIGMYDERFCGIGFQEGDYFLRARLYYAGRSSINDYGHCRRLNLVWDGVKHFIVRSDTERGIGRKDGRSEHIAEEALKEFGYIEKVFDRKWGDGLECNRLKYDWDVVYLSQFVGREARDKQFYLYPYFEKEIRNREKLYAII